MKDLNFNYNCYEKCSHYYYFNELNEYNCIDNCQGNINKLIENKKKCIDKCENDDTYQYEYKNKCYQKCPKGTRKNDKSFSCIVIGGNDNLNIVIDSLINSENNYNNTHTEIQDIIFEKIKEFMKDRFNFTDIDKGNDFIYNYEKTSYIISSTSNQKKNNDSNISTIDLGECENKLKEKYNISTNDSLYIFKTDIFIEYIRKVEYSVYYIFPPNNLTRLNLDICKDMKIDMFIPIEIPNNESYKYNISSNYYNDICTLTNETKAGKILKDRQNEYKINNISVCEENCEFTEYDTISKKAKCSCFTKLEMPIISQIKVDKEKLFSNFKNIKNIANFQIFKCIYLLFDTKNILQNIANYIIIILFLISIISIIIFICYDSKKIKKIITKNSPKKKKIKLKEKKKKKATTNNEIRIANNIFMKKNNRLKENRYKKNQIFLNLNTSNLNSHKSFINNNSHRNKNKKILSLRKLTTKNKTQNLGNKNKRFKKKKRKSSKSSKFNDNEMNSLNYKDAKTKDKRNYFQYYLSLLKTKHFLIFSFCQFKDFNSKSIKVYIFFFTFTINYFISALFYSDNTMNKIYVDDGSFDFTYQLPQMVYSLILSSFLKILLNILGLYEKNIISYKHDKKRTINKKKFLFYIRLKIGLFFIITYILLLVFWVYIGCFCAVYKSTQIHLLIDVSSSFGLSFISPFFIYLLPGIFRMQSLKKNVNRPLLFKFSKLLQHF